MNLTEYQNYHESKSHTSLEFPYNTYLCCIPMDFTHVPIHWHNEMELIVIQKGSGIISVDFITHEVKAGDIVFVLPGQLHSIRQKKKHGWNMRTFSFIHLCFFVVNRICAEQISFFLLWKILLPFRPFSLQMPLLMNLFPDASEKSIISAIPDQKAISLQSKAGSSSLCFILCPISRH